MDVPIPIESDVSPFPLAKQEVSPDRNIKVVQSAKSALSLNDSPTLRKGRKRVLRLTKVL